MVHNFSDPAMYHQDTLMLPELLTAEVWRHEIKFQRVLDKYSLIIKSLPPTINLGSLLEVNFPNCLLLDNSNSSTCASLFNSTVSVARSSISRLAYSLSHFYVQRGFMNVLCKKTHCYSKISLQIPKIFFKIFSFLLWDDGVLPLFWFIVWFMVCP